MENQSVSTCKFTWYSATPKPGAEIWVPSDYTVGSGSHYSVYIPKCSVHTALIRVGDWHKSLVGVGCRASICLSNGRPFQAYETIWFTDKMRCRETLAAVLSMGRVINCNTLISRVNLFVGDVHFPRRPYDGQIGCIWTKLCSRLSPDHLSLSLGDSNGRFIKLLSYIIHGK